PRLLRDKLRNGGAVTFASAAALTLGRVTVPVYEIYKAGADPHWLDGLDLLAELEISAAVIPHYDNAEGGHHDTRFCYLGERRLRAMEAELPDATHVIGIDEHTGVVLDLEAGTATVVGNGRLTLRVDGQSETHPSGTVLPLDELRTPGQAGGGTPAAAPRTSAGPEAGEADASDASTPTTSLLGQAEALWDRFQAALAAGDTSDAGAAALELETALVDWSADTLQSDEADRARSLLRQMIVALADTASKGVVPRRDHVAPFVEQLLALRASSRAEKRFDIADAVRDGLVAAGIEVRDTADGVEWDAE
ncbi:MAG: hypothetical protein R2701_13615, partial [Acidimicrobiales bacterium]